MLLHPPKPLLVLQHPLKFCSQGPKVKYTFFNPLIIPLAPVFLSREESMLMVVGTCFWGPAEQGHCRQFLQTSPFPCRQPLRFLSCRKRNTLYGEQRWVACCSWGSTERPQHYKSCSVCTITSEQPYTSRKGRTDQTVFSFFTIFLIGLWRINILLESAWREQLSSTRVELPVNPFCFASGTLWDVNAAAIYSCGSNQRRVLWQPTNCTFVLCQHHMQPE